MFTVKSLTALLAAAGLASAAPFGPRDVTPTTNTFTSVIPVNSAVVTHRVTAGFNGLNFEPKNVVANIGDVVEFKFLGGGPTGTTNHSVAESSFDLPCQPLVDPNSGAQTGVFAGFDFLATGNGVLATDVYQIVVKDTKPRWIYCPQPKGLHCVNGMSMVINQNFDNGKTLDVYQAKAKANGFVVVPSTIQGGLEGPNPNPLNGFPKA
jgi:hypothetical protein